MKKYFNDIWLGLYTVLVGMKITWEHLFAKKVTNQYPDRYHPIKEKFDSKKSWFEGDPNNGAIPANSRNRLFLDYDLCSGCGGCARACPVNCITVDTIKVVPGDPDATPLKDGSKRGLWVAKFEIDMAKCCFCSFCVEPCPSLAIQMTKDFEYSTQSRDDLLYSFSEMSPEMVVEKQKMADKFQLEKKKEAAAKKAADAKKKAEEAAKTENDENYENDKNDK